MLSVYMYDFLNRFIKVDVMLLSVTYSSFKISGQHQIPVNLLHSVPLNSVDAEVSQAAVMSSTVMQTTTPGPAVHQTSYNTVYRITTSSPMLHQMYPLGSTIGNPAEMN